MQTKVLAVTNIWKPLSLDKLRVGAYILRGSLAGFVLEKNTVADGLLIRLASDIRPGRKHSRASNYNELVYKVLTVHLAHKEPLLISPHRSITAADALLLSNKLEDQVFTKAGPFDLVKYLLQVKSNREAKDSQIGIQTYKLLAKAIEENRVKIFSPKKELAKKLFQNFIAGGGFLTDDFDPISGRDLVRKICLYVLPLLRKFAPRRVFIKIKLHERLSLLQVDIGSDPGYRLKRLALPFRFFFSEKYPSL